MLFRFFLQRGKGLRYDKQIGALRFIDMTIVKFMLTAIFVATIGGGLLFGIGWGLIGYCLGTSIGAIGEGCWDGLWGVLGMLVGGALYAEAYPLIFK